jgi:hypothetical protein
MMVTRSRTFSAAWAGGDHPVGEAITTAVGRLGDTRPELVLFFAGAELDPENVIDRAGEAAAGVRVAGMSATGLMTSDGLRRGGCSAMAFGGEGVKAGVGVAPAASRDLRAAGSAAVAAAIDGLELSAGRGVILLFLDPGSGDSRQAVDGAYEVVGGQIPLAGGGAGGSHPALYAAGFAQADAVVAVAITGAAAVEVAIAHGCRLRPVPAIATRVEGRTVMELDGRPAETVYLELVGRPDEVLSDEEFRTLAVLHPLAQPALRGTARLRHVSGRAPGGGLACVTTIPQNAAVWPAEQTELSIIESAAYVAKS